MRTLSLGHALTDRIEEHTLPVSLTLLTSDEALIARRVDPLPSGFLDRATMNFQFSNHSWVLRVDGRTVLVDPCTGNGRTGRGPYFDGLDVPYLDRLAAVGVTPEAVDVVFCTHLHHDHCGWNTRWSEGSWVPTFPNADYVFAEEEYRRWDTERPAHSNGFNPNVFDECVRPVAEAGLAKVVPLPYEISPSLTVEHAPGHTLGHAVLGLNSGGVRAYFTGDAFHHPVQLTRPELHLPGCDDLETAVATRRALVQRALDEDAFLFPAHFPAPHYGRLALDGDEVRFVPGGAAHAVGPQQPSVTAELQPSREQA
ncbi:MBL fold metallo-hydrolase [Streptomyces sp. Agncl-13]|uniref:MBL fold metallo-hydrolase n=1 Tax=Streptomyces sp. Agncl-13 TaxID=3400628 RepID=UPI003A84C318